MKTIGAHFYLWPLLVSALLLAAVDCPGQTDSNWNLDFENWVDSTIANTVYGVETDFEVEGRKKGDVEGWTPWAGSMIRTTDTESGDYAIVLNDWYLYKEAHMVLGANADNSWPFNCNSCGVPIDFQPTAISGSYKIIQLATDVDSLRGIVSVYLTRYDEALGKRDTVGSAQRYLSETNEAYKNFELLVTYDNSGLMPDTMILLLSLKRYSDHAPGLPPTGCNYCSYVFFDNLQIGQEATRAGSLAGNEERSFSFYPNPGTAFLYIENHLSQVNEITLFNRLGQQLDQIRINPKEGLWLEVSYQSAGLYFLSDQTNTYKLILE